MRALAILARPSLIDLAGLAHLTVAGPSRGDTALRCPSVRGACGRAIAGRGDAQNGAQVGLSYVEASYRPGHFVVVSMLIACLVCIESFDMRVKSRLAGEPPGYANTPA
jgi:hypothetical protein